jgi:hypothetical protein
MRQSAAYLALDGHTRVFNPRATLLLWAPIVARQRQLLNSEELYHTPEGAWIKGLLLPPPDQESPYKEITAREAANWCTRHRHELPRALVDDLEGKAGPITPAEPPQPTAKTPPIPQPEPDGEFAPKPRDERQRNAEKLKPVSAEDRRLEVVATIEALLDSKCWGVTREEIAKKMRIPYSTFCRYLEHKTVASMWERYERDSMGKPPCHLDDLGEGTWFSLRGEG